MLKIGVDMIREHPWLGLGPEMIAEGLRELPAEVPEAVNATNPHLHNVPIQIAAERGLPAMAAWLWFVAVRGTGSLAATPRACRAGRGRGGTGRARRDAGGRAV